MARRSIRRTTNIARLEGPLRQQPSTVRMVDVAARMLPWHSSYLHRSLTLWFLLRRQGIVAELQIGVCKADDQLRAHAWVESGGLVLNDGADAKARYTSF